MIFLLGSAVLAGLVGQAHQACGGPLPLRSGGMRYDDWKLVFTEQREEGFNVWQEPYVSLRVPKL